MRRVGPYSHILQIFCLLILQLAVICQSFAQAVAPGLREQFQNTNIIFLGELHTVAEHKVLLRDILNDLSADNSIDSFAFEFTRSDSQEIVDQYLKDPAATRGSANESKYLAQLNQAYSNMFNNSDYDEVYRSLKKIYISKNGHFRVCAIDVSSGTADDIKNGAFYSRLMALPTSLKNELIKSTGKSLKELSENMGSAYDREAMMAINIARCASGAQKLLVFMGMSHTFELERIFPEQGPRNTESYTRILLPDASIKSAIIAEAFPNATIEESDNWPMFSADCIRATQSMPWALYSSADVPSNLKACTFVSIQGQSFDFKSLSDFVIFGQSGHEIK